jgi:hypothetical protein
MFQLKATVKLIRATQQVSEKFRKREFVVTDNSSQFPQFITFQATQERCDLLNNIKEGDEVEIGFFLKGREWKDNRSGEIKFFNSLEAFRLTKASSSSAPSSENIPQEPLGYSGDEVDDLPF